jgi:chaperone modulatory protein CbpM
MNAKQINMTVLAGVVLEEHTELSMTEICRVCRVDQSIIVSLVEEGIVEPSTRDEMPWRFSEVSLPKVERALRLQRDLELNLSGVAFVLDLLEEIDQLQTRLKLLSDKQ